MNSDSENLRILKITAKIRDILRKTFTSLRFFTQLCGILRVVKVILVAPL
jgi:hypothetical protein